MTTESKQVTRPQGVPVLLGAAAAGLAVALGAVAVAAVVDGRAAAAGAGTGAGLALGVFLVGSLAVDTVARIMPAASLMVALLTYTLEVVAMALVFAALTRSGLLGETLSRGWLAAGVIVVTAGWLLAQVWFTTRARIPAYDLRGTTASDDARDGAATPSAGVPGRPEAGAR